MLMAVIIRTWGIAGILLLIAVTVMLFFFVLPVFLAIVAIGAALAVISSAVRKLRQPAKKSKNYYPSNVIEAEYKIK